MINADSPAFPVSEPTGMQNSGLTKREYFATIALQGICAAYKGTMPMSYNNAAKKAVKLADELIKELNNVK